MMDMIYQFLEHRPQIHETAYVAPTAVVIGRATLKQGASVWFNTVIRADINSIEIGENTNVQDSSVIHVTHEHSVQLGDRITVGHAAVIHGARIDSDCLIAMGAVILDGAHIGSGSIVAAGAVVAPGMMVPENSLLMGIPARVVRRVHSRDKERFERNWRNYLEYSKQYMEDGNLVLLPEPE
ncbi:MAG: gamma carbonic anhydrase family protein [Candidatus Obscuribacterales bacterium]